MAKKKTLFHQDNAPCHKSMITMVKLHELHIEMLPHPPYTPYLAPSDYWLFADLKKMLQGKIFRSNGEVNAETGAYFTGKDQIVFKHGIEKEAKLWTDCIALRWQLCWWIKSNFEIRLCLLAMHSKRTIETLGSTKNCVRLCVMLKVTNRKAGTIFEL